VSQESHCAWSEAGVGGCAVGAGLAWEFEHGQACRALEGLQGSARAGRSNGPCGGDVRCAGFRQQPRSPTICHHRYPPTSSSSSSLPPLPHTLHRTSSDGAGWAGAAPAKCCCCCCCCCSCCALLRDLAGVPLPPAPACTMGRRSCCCCCSQAVMERAAVPLVACSSGHGRGGVREGTRSLPRAAQWPRCMQAHGPRLMDGGGHSACQATRGGRRTWMGFSARARTCAAAPRPHCLPSSSLARHTTW